MELGSQHIEQTRYAMYRILLGGILWAIDIPIGGFDYFPDFVGTFIIAFGGLLPLSKLPLHARYRFILKITFWIAIMYGTYEGHIFFIARPWAINPILDYAFGFFLYGGVFLFCLSMMWLCERRNYGKTSKAWRLSAITTILVYTSYFTIVPLTYRFIITSPLIEQKSMQFRDSLILSFALFQYYLSFLPFVILACTLVAMLLALHHDPLKKTAPELA